MPDPIVIRKYDPAWVGRFEAERQKLAEALRPHARLAEEVRDDIAAYIDGKTEFVGRCLEAADREQPTSQRIATAPGAR